MYMAGRSIGFECRRDNYCSRPHAPYLVQLGYGEGSGEEYEPRYQHNISIQLRPWRSWFIWYRQFLTIENDECVYQDRICGFWRWPMSFDWS